MCGPINQSITDLSHTLIAQCISSSLHCDGLKPAEFHATQDAEIQIEANPLFVPSYCTVDAAAAAAAFSVLSYMTSHGVGTYNLYFTNNVTKFLRLERLVFLYSFLIRKKNNG